MCLQQDIAAFLHVLRRRFQQGDISIELLKKEFRAIFQFLCLMNRSFKFLVFLVGGLIGILEFFPFLQIRWLRCKDFVKFFWIGTFRILERFERLVHIGE